MKPEALLHRQVCDYLRYQYPNVLFRTDMGGVRLTINQARQAARLQKGKSWPDLFIAEPIGSLAVVPGLFIELKATEIWKKDGTLRANPHVAEQAEILAALRDRGYKAEFAVGFEEAKQIIDDYLKQGGH